ncbi:hypothetical protein E6O75_ATG10428 [Venturia nashicola]|uniref:PHD-type domain-containing protein n=1 Tax=Venturia nashicola TaxID=86259 RepID=A0A4Z1P6U8_9PEZI|nr:hypothetical protein E6O75_ATG10428 [Venturia nashicola]
MNVEPQTHGLPDWHFPSPSSTPKSAAFQQAPFQTPKFDQPSHFLDAYYTPQITGHQTPVQTPTYHKFTVVKKSAPPSPLTPNDPSFHINHFKGPHLPLPPVEPAWRLTSSPDPATSSTTLQRSSSAPKLEPKGEMNPFQMQTPPPTRDSSSRRESLNGQQGAPYNPPSVGYHGQASTPTRPPSQQSLQTPHFQTSYQSQELQFSPEIFQYGGPASAPPMPLVRNPWDQSPAMVDYGNIGMADAQQHLFGPDTSFNHAFQEWQLQNMSPMQPQESVQRGFQQQQHHTPSQLQPQLQHQPMPQHTPMQIQQPSQPLDFWSTPAIHSQSTGSFTQETSSFASTSTVTGVNPNMIFSFTSPPPQKSETVSVRPQLTQRMVDTGGRQPYEHQMRESSREKEIAATKRSKAPIRSSSGSSSIALPNNGRPNLQRSNTDSGVRRANNRSVDSRRSMQAAEPIVRRSSPLKRNSLLSLQAIPEVQAKPKMRLVVDENGRARTETVDSLEEEEEPLDSRKSLGLWMDDDDDSDEDAMLISQRNSFAYSSDQLRRRPSKHARTVSDPDRFDPIKRPVSSASMASLTTRLEATPIGKRSSSSSNYLRARPGSFAGTLSAENIRALQESAVDEEPTDAQGALRKLMEGRRRKDQNHPRVLLNAHNQRWPQASTNTMQEQHDPYNGNTFPNSTLSPTSDDSSAFVPTPSTSRSTHSDDSTRCVCNNEASEETMFIQCESCTKWLHVRCVGLNQHSLPPVYVCIFCTGSTPVARGGRVREPLRREALGRDSPLGYKSGNYRR